VLDQGAVDFVRHVLQPVHDLPQVIQDFRRDPEVQRPCRSLRFKQAATRSIMQIVRLALNATNLLRQTANLGCVGADRAATLRDRGLSERGGAVRTHRPLWMVDSALLPQAEQAHTTVRSLLKGRFEGQIAAP